MIVIKQKGNFDKTNKFLKNASLKDKTRILSRYGEMGVKALSAATPKDSGETANSWYYEIQQSRGRIGIVWGNRNVNNGVPIAIILQYGHGTGTGGYVAGRDYINPAIRPVFDKLANEIWKEVTR